MFTTTIRLIKYGLKNFARNGWLSAATIVVMILALLFFMSLFIFSFLTNSALNTVKDKVDISVFFEIPTPEDEILRIQSLLEDLKEVKTVDYISRDEALERFKAKHFDDAAAEALKELEDNPLMASLNIKAYNPEDFAQIASYLNQDNFTEVINNVTYDDNRIVIDRLSRIITNVNVAGFALTIIFAIIAVLVAFNTIWLAMYSSREEISIMRLVGASNTYIRGPYVVEGIIYGVIAGVVSILITIPVVIFVSPWLERLDASLNLHNYFFTNFISLSFYQILFGVLLGSISSFIAIRRYLKI